MKKVTIVGFYEDNQQPFVVHETVADCRKTEIMKAVARGLLAIGESDQRVSVVEVFNGHHRGIGRLDENLEFKA